MARVAMQHFCLSTTHAQPRLRELWRAHRKTFSVISGGGKACLIIRTICLMVSSARTPLALFYILQLLQAEM